MARTKVTKRQQLSEWLLRRGRRQRIKRTCPYKIKLTLSEHKQVNMKKNGQVIKTIKVNVFQNKKCQIILIAIAWKKSSFLEKNTSLNLP